MNKREVPQKRATVRSGRPPGGSRIEPVRPEAKRITPPLAPVVRRDPGPAEPASAGPASGAGRLYRCPHCGTVADSMASEVCRCVSARPSVLCPLCGGCWCTAPVGVRLRLWHEAPAALETRLAELRKQRNPAAAGVESAGPTVLIVDDDVEILEIAAYAVRQLGYRPITVDNPATALDAVERNRPAVVITDALMPRLDGRELCRLIKGAFAGTKVVIMTSIYTAPHYKYEAFRNFKADEYLPKPIDFGRLREVLTRLVRAGT